MQSQRRGGGDGPNKQGQEELKIKAPDLKAPDPHEMMRLAGVKDLVLEEGDTEEGATEQGDTDQAESQDSSAKQDRNRGRRRLICFCGDSSCRIGPFTKVEEVPG